MKKSRFCLPAAILVLSLTLAGCASDAEDTETATRKNIFESNSTETEADMNSTQNNLAYSGAAVEEETELATEAAAEVLDEEAPVFTWSENFAVTQGDSVSYKSHVKVEDNLDPEPTITVDKSEVDLNTIGTYTVYYTATDASGNSSQISLTVTVTEKPVMDESTVGPLCDEIIASLGVSGANETTLWALYDWCRNNISYTASYDGDTSSIWAGAYVGITEGRGDCFVSYATFAALLTRAGIDNVQVSRVGGATHHYWNLVHIDGMGDGWYHCDTSRRNRNFPYTCYMQTDAQIAAYTVYDTQKANYYTFDGTNLPARGTTPIYDGGMGML